MIEIKNSSVVINYYTTNEEKKQVPNTKMELYEHSKQTTRNCTAFFVDYLKSKKEYSKAKRVESCGNFLQLRFYPEIEKTKLHSINLCRERLCLNCQFNLARERAKVLRKVINSRELYFTTLTVENCAGDKLRNIISKMVSAQIKWFRSLQIKDFYRSVEITYNKTSKTFHPHLHIIHFDELPFSPSQLNRKWRECVTRENIYCSREWLSCKQEIVRDYNSASMEMSKYITKPTDITRDSLSVLYNQCKGLHLHQARGVFRSELKRAKEELELEENKKNEYLDSFDYELLSYLWNGNNYVKCDLKSYAEVRGSDGLE